MADLGRGRRAAPVGHGHGHSPGRQHRAARAASEPERGHVERRYGGEGRFGADRRSCPARPALRRGLGAYGKMARHAVSVAADGDERGGRDRRMAARGIGLHAPVDIERPCDQLRAPADRIGNPALPPPGDADRPARPVGDFAARRGGLHGGRPGLARQPSRDQPDAGPFTRRASGPKRSPTTRTVPGTCFSRTPVSRTSERGGTGTPTLATAAQGETLLAWAIEDLSALVRAALIEEPPFAP